jgi:folate-binding protein YgfZ
VAESVDSARSATPERRRGPRAGENSPVTHTGELGDQYEALARGCGLVDRSERGKLALSGSGAVEFLNGQVTNELAGIASGEGRYAAFLTHKGKMLGDLRILAAGATPQSPVELLLDTERVALQALFDMIRHYKVGYEVELHKRTLEVALFSLIGPRARRVAAAASGGPTLDLAEDEHSHRPAIVAGCSVRLVSTRLGEVDLLLDASDRETVWAALLAAGAQAVPGEVAEVVRVERGVPRHGLDIDESTIPQEAGLNERAVSFTKGCYVGQETVARLFYKGKPNRHLRGMRLSAPASPGARIYRGERLVGTLGSSVVSPALGPIGLALVRREVEAGSAVAIGDDHVGAEVVALPFALRSPPRTASGGGLSP